MMQALTGERTTREFDWYSWTEIPNGYGYAGDGFGDGVIGNSEGADDGLGGE